MSAPEQVNVKFDRLRDDLKTSHAVLVAFSGGVDSTLLAKVSVDVLGENCHAITCVSPTMAKTEIGDAIKLGKELGFGKRHHVIESNELERPGFSDNPTHRCALCKTELMHHALPLAKKLNAKIVLGTNTNDLGDLRPGIEAARSQGAYSPFVDADLNKSEIRLLSKKLGLRTWDKPQLACLSSRFPYGTKITKERLQSVDQFEAYLWGLGLQNVRVRFHDNVARIEIDAVDMSTLIQEECRLKVVEAGKKAGFSYVALDLQGFRSGSLNEPLVQIQKKH